MLRKGAPSGRRGRLRKRPARDRADLPASQFLPAFQTVETAADTPTKQIIFDYQNIDYRIILGITIEVRKLMPEAPNRPVSPSDLEPQPWSSADGDPPTTPPDWREATLRRLEAWIDEEERLIAEIERRIAAALDSVALFPSRPAAAPSVEEEATTRESTSPRTPAERDRAATETASGDAHDGAAAIHGAAPL